MTEPCLVMTAAEWVEFPEALKGTDESWRWVWCEDPVSRQLIRMPVYVDTTCATALRDADRVWSDKAPA